MDSSYLPPVDADDAVDYNDDDVDDDEEEDGTGGAMYRGVFVLLLPLPLPLLSAGTRIQAASSLLLFNE